MYAKHMPLALPLGFQWSGCSDNLSYGVAFSQTFVDEPERAKGMSSGRPLMNIHNNEAGRKASKMFHLLTSNTNHQLHIDFYGFLCPCSGDPP